MAKSLRLKVLLNFVPQKELRGLLTRRLVCRSNGRQRPGLAASQRRGILHALPPTSYPTLLQGDCDADG
jgi:hypothetical protein